VVYAHWTATLKVDAQVTTGSIVLHWENVFTDDDGTFNSGMDNEDGNGAIAPIYVYEADGTTSSDPSSAGPMATRYNKDVADCIADVSSDGSTLQLRVRNAYPSYHCTMWSTFGNEGSVPVKLQSIVTTIYKGDVANYNLGDEGTWNTLQGTLCGLQIDPGAAHEVTTINTLHIQNAADPGTTYRVAQTLNFVNYNEWVAADCTHTFNNAVSVLPVVGG
jgi:hypothetical protein